MYEMPHHLTTAGVILHRPDTDCRFYTDFRYFGKHEGASQSVKLMQYLVHFERELICFYLFTYTWYAHKSSTLMLAHNTMKSHQVKSSVLLIKTFPGLQIPTE